MEATSAEVKQVKATMGRVTERMDLIVKQVSILYGQNSWLALFGKATPFVLPILLEQVKDMRNKCLRIVPVRK